MLRTYAGAAGRGRVLGLCLQQAQEIGTVNDVPAGDEDDLGCVRAVGADEVLTAARAVAARDGASGVMTSHVLLALLEADAAAASLLRRAGFTPVAPETQHDSDVTAPAQFVSPRTRALFDHARREARRLGAEPNDLHVLLGLIESADARRASGIPSQGARLIRAAVFDTLQHVDPGPLPPELPSLDAAPRPAPRKRHRMRRAVGLVGLGVVIALVLTAAFVVVEWPADLAQRPSFAPVGANATASDDAVAASPPPAGAAATMPSAPPRPGVVFVAYVIPIDGREQSWLAPAIRHEVNEVRRWYAQQTGGAGPRFASGDGGDLGVALVRIQQTGDEVRRAGDGSFSMVVDQARSAVGAGTGDLVLVYADILGPPDVCGLGVTGEGAVLWMPTCTIYPNRRARFPDDATYLAAHELTHALGAVASCAPHFVDGHVRDDPRDLLFTGGERDWENLVLDVNHDDYYGARAAGCPQITDSPAWQTSSP